jgi:aminoglycoside/choline kinase family phosphotransferase
VTDSPINPSEETLPAELTDFLRAALGAECRIVPLHGDVSIRRYFRVHSGDDTLIAAYYPEAVRESLTRFLRAHASLSGARVPGIVQHSAAALLQRDVGDETLFDIVHRDREAAIPLYREAIALLADFQEAPVEAREINPPFDRKKFRDELEMTAEFYVAQLCGKKVDGTLLSIFDDIAADISSHPYVLCHRDYHGQNIHVVNGDLYVIDFQDLRMGPDTYDLASLLRDRGVGKILGDDVELQFLAEYGQRIGAEEGLRSRYFRTLLQRSIKAIGTFAKAAITRDRKHYLEFIPPTLEAIERCLAEVPEYEALRSRFPFQYDAAQTNKGETQ